MTSHELVRRENIPAAIPAAPTTGWHSCPPHRWEALPASGLDFMRNVVRIGCLGCGMTASVTHEYIAHMRARTERPRPVDVVTAAKRPELKST